MEQRKVGRSELSVSVLGLGCNNFGMRIGAEETAAVVQAAVEAGVTHFDTAEMYGGGKSEEFLGAALAALGARDDVTIATKFGKADAGGSRADIITACEGSLARLGTDHIDLYYQHYPDGTTPIDETLEALNDLVQQGKVRYIGSSNVTSAQISDAEQSAEKHGTARFTACQMEWSLLNRDIEAEIVPSCRDNGLGVVAYFPLASGLLTGKYTQGEAAPEGSRFAAIPYFAGVATEENWAKVNRFSAYAADHDHSLTSLALGWVASQPSTATVLVGATRPEQVAANADAIGWHLSAEDLAALDTGAA